MFVKEGFLEPRYVIAREYGTNVQQHMRWRLVGLCGLTAATILSLHAVTEYTGELTYQLEPEMIAAAAENFESQPIKDPFPSYELLPDLVPLPARDVKVEKTGGKTLLYFSTTYFNQGEGTLELRADPGTAGIREDIERDVLQRVYFRDGKYRDIVVGNFLWHQEHLHYHFTDFIAYDLVPVDAREDESLSGNLVKSTFCLRDVSRVDLDIPNRPSDAQYKICGKELQGVSVGWGDTYYWDYPAQNLDITGLASGTYRLTFNANPEKRIEEITYDNNMSSVLFRLDMENATVEVIKEAPSQSPGVEHVYLDDPFGVNPTYPKPAATSTEKNSP